MRCLFGWAIALHLGLLLGFVEIASAAPSFDCRRASNATEHAICRSPDLSQTDVQIAALYKRALAQLPAAANQVRDAQRAWIVRRNACGGDLGCLQQVYQQRLAELGQAGPAAIASASPSFDCKRASSKAEREICRSPELSKADADMAAYYKRALARFPGKAEEISAAQRTFIKQRDACAGGCMGELYQDRVADLAQVVAGTDAPAAPAALPSAVCTRELATARALARSVNVIVGAPAKVQAKTKIELRWSRMAQQPQIPVFLVVDTPADVRFDGRGFLALTAGARGPFGMAHASDRARAFVPMHRAGSASAGSFHVLPQRAGPQRIGWALVTAGGCGEAVLAKGASDTFLVTLGAPEIVIQDRFGADQPKERIRDRSGQYELLVFEDRYEVRDAGSGARILARPGVEPHFSPTGRFIAARRTQDNELEVIDLVSGDVAATFAPGLLAWARNDSIVLNGAQRDGNFNYALTLSGRSHILGSGCTPCRPWRDTDVVLDVDRGFIALLTNGVGNLHDLVEEPPSLLDDKLEQPSQQLHTRVRQTYGHQLHFTPNRWDLGEPIVLSHAEGIASIPDPEHWIGKTQLLLVVHHPKVAPSAQLAQAKPEPAGMLRGRSFSRGLQFAPADAPAIGVETMLVRIASEVLPLGLAQNTRRETYEPLYAQPTPQEQAKIKSLTERISADVPAFKAVLRTDGCASLGAEALDPAHISTVWSWSERNAQTYVLQTECIEGSFQSRSGSIVLLHRNPANGDGLVTDVTAALIPEGMPNDTGPLGISSRDTAELKIVPVGEGAFLIAAFASGKAALIAEATGNRIGAILSLSDVALLETLRLSKDRQHVLQLNKDGAFRVFRLSDGEVLLLGAHIDDEIVTMTPDGRFDTSYEGGQALQVRFAGLKELQTIYQFRGALYRQGLAASILSGQPVEPRPPSIGVPPTVELSVNAAAEAGRRRGNILARSETGLASLRIHVDGRLLEERPVEGLSAAAPLDIADPGGGRWLTVVAVDRSGLASLPSAIHLPGPVRARGRMRAVVVGIDTYTPQEYCRKSGECFVFEPLASAARDARAFAAALDANKGRVSQSLGVQMLFDAAATEQAILSAVGDAAQAVGPDDTMVLFFAGHALDPMRADQSGELMLALSSTKVTDIANTSLPWSKVAQAMSMSKGTVLVVLDACHAGLTGSQALASNDGVVNTLLTASGAPMIVLAGSKGREYSLERTGGGGGLFTSAIVAAITSDRRTVDRDGNGVIDLSELYSAVRARVAREARDMLQKKQADSDQTPWIARNSLIGEMPLF